MIREATPSDLSAMIAMSKAMHLESPVFSSLTWDEGLVAYHGLNNITNNDCLALVADVDGQLIGMLLASVSRHFFSYDLMTIDSALYVKPENRGGSVMARMILAYVAWAKVKGAVRVVIGHSTGVKKDKAVAYYQKLGFTHCGDSMEMRI